MIRSGSLLLVSIASFATSVQSRQFSDGLPSSINPATNLVFERPDLPNRKKFKLYLPENYEPNVPSKLTFYFHGWCGSGSVSDRLQDIADQFNYIVVSPTGLSQGFFECSSWQNYGSNTGFDSTGTEPTCDTSQNQPDYCYNSCKPCENRCQWSHCMDDDIDFVRDLIEGGDGFENALKDLVCFDPANVFSTGTSNGGMFTWTLVQDERTAPLIAAGAPIIGAPHCGYDFAPATQTPMVSFMGIKDETVSPTNEPFPGEPTDECITNRDGDAYLYVAGPQIMKTWAKAGPDSCSDNVIDDEFPSRRFNFPDLTCSTWCKGGAPYAVDCYFDEGHTEPTYALEGAFRFFELHSN